jgi:hypothetical protein
METVLGAILATVAELVIVALIVAWKPFRARAGRTLSTARETFARLRDRSNIRPPRLVG